MPGTISFRALFCSILKYYRWRLYCFLPVCGLPRAHHAAQPPFCRRLSSKHGGICKHAPRIYHPSNVWGARSLRGTAYKTLRRAAHARCTARLRNLARSRLRLLPRKHPKRPSSCDTLLLHACSPHAFHRTTSLSRIRTHLLHTRTFAPPHTAPHFPAHHRTAPTPLPHRQHLSFWPLHHCHAALLHMTLRAARHAATKSPRASPPHQLFQ